MKERLSTIDIREQQVKSRFLSKLSEAQNWLSNHQIPFRIIGGLALRSYLDFPFNYCRDAKTGYQKVPDIDLIVPRKNLPEVESYRKTLLQGNFPVDLALPSARLHIDFRPDEEDSYLTHKNLGVPFETDLWKPVIRHIETTPVLTIPPRTLFHTFVVCGGTLRNKDWKIILPLGRYILQNTEEYPQTETDYLAVHRFLKQRRKLYPLDVKMMWFAETQVPRLPPFLYFLVCDKLNPFVDLYFRLWEKSKWKE